MEKKQQFILSTLEDGMEKMKKSREQYRKQENELYWIEIKMQNNRALFSDEERDTISSLRLFLETILVFTEKIIELEILLREDIEKLRQVGEYEEQKQLFAAMKAKFDMLYLFCEVYREKQNEYAGILQQTEKITKRSGRSVLDKLRKYWF